MDIIKKEDISNANMFTLTDKLKGILKNATNTHNNKDQSLNTTQFNKTKILSSQTKHVKSQKSRSGIKKGKLIKTKPLQNSTVSGKNEKIVNNGT